MIQTTTAFMSQEQQNFPEVHLGNMVNGSNLNQNGQDASLLFNNNNGMMSLNSGAPMMGGQHHQNSSSMMPSHMGPPTMDHTGTSQHQQHQPQQQQNIQQQHQSNPGTPQQQPQIQPNQQQQQGSFNFNNELKRLQQLQQFNGQGGSQNGLLGGMAGQQQAMNQQAMLLQSMQSMLDQKVQNPRFDSNPVFNPMFQPGLMQDARLLMAQSQIPMAMQNMGEVPLPSPHSLFHRDGTRRMRGGVIEPFPEKLHRLLLEVEAAGRSDVISFVANGRAFAIHKPDKFFKEIVPLYFRQSRLSSFKRQLNLYGFELINTGPSRGGYFHELFVKDRPELCRRMRRVAVKVSGSGNSKEGGTSGGKRTDAVEPEKYRGLDLDACAVPQRDDSDTGRKMTHSDL